jgi:hypothetical protein
MTIGEAVAPAELSTAPAVKSQKAQLGPAGAVRTTGLLGLLAIGYGLRCGRIGWKSHGRRI